MHRAYYPGMEHIFRIWPTLKAMASDLGKPYPTVAAWKQRGSIPAQYDVDLVRAAAARGQNLTFEELALARSAATHVEGDHQAAAV